MVNSAQTHDVVIVGGGLVGLCAAYHLTGARKVGVILGNHKGRASTAAAGMLTPTCEWSMETPRSFLDFLRSGRDYFDQFSTQVLGSAEPVSALGYCARPYLLLDLVEATTDLTQRFESLRAAGAEVAWLSKQDVCKREPYLNAEALRGAILVSGDTVVNPRALHAVLVERIASQADLAHGNLVAVAELGEHFELTLDDGSVFVSPTIIIAAGAWSFEVASLFHLDVPVAPCKGQIVQLSGPSGLLSSILYLPVGACGCVLERSPGVYIAGTSEEYVSADATNTCRVVTSILKRVSEVFLPSGDFVIDEMWSGFRPFMPDELPLISVSTDPRIILATGHYRNGVLLSPLTGLIVKDLVEGNRPSVDIHPYRYQREYLPHYRFASAY